MRCNKCNMAEEFCECPQPSVRVEHDVSGLITKEDYAQVFNETCMSVIEGLLKHAYKAQIMDAPKMMAKWINYYWQENEK